MLSTTSTSRGSSYSDAVIVSSSRTLMQLDQAAGLQHGAHRAGLDGLRGGAVEDADGASVGVPEAEHQVDGRRLPGAVGTEQGDHLAGLHGQVDAVDGHGGAVRLAECPQLDRRSGEVVEGHVLATPLRGGPGVVGAGFQAKTR